MSISMFLRTRTNTFIRHPLILSSRYIGTLVIAEHESGSLTSASLSSVAAASKFLSKDNSLSLLLAGAGPSLQDAAANAASCHPSVSQESSRDRGIRWMEEEEDGNSKFVKQTSQESERPDLGTARVVITGGRALKSAENFKMIEKLARKNLMQAAIIGATYYSLKAKKRYSHKVMVGQTGKIVAPELYMAFGVSGAIQHIAGMRDSKVIVAVNKDADAPIFQVADYGLVGDLFEIIPELLEKLPEKK
ncbi:electron transfer flavoprotein subunit alpha, mitochondrial [Tanacetum coccineum]